MKHFYWIVTVLLIAIYLLISEKSKFSYRSPTFLSSQETGDLLQRDPESYVKNMSPPDLHARGSSSPEEYLSQIVSSASEFSEKEKELLSRLSQKIDDKIETHSGSLLINVDKKLLASLPWKFSKTKGVKCENGLSHTRRDVIFFSSDKLDSTTSEKDLMRTLIHEKSHVYQRQYPKVVDQDISSAGYRRVTSRKNIPLSRSNCDLDEWVYSLKNSPPLVIEYNSSTPSSILDHSGVREKEHPFEVMAYNLESIIN